MVFNLTSREGCSRCGSRCGIADCTVCAGLQDCFRCASGNAGSSLHETFYTLAAEDVGSPVVFAFGRVWLVSGFLGRVLTGDVGKRVFLRSGILQVESDGQCAERKGRT